MSSIQQVIPETAAINIEENSGQIAIGNYIVQIGSVHGGVVNVAMPDQKPQLQPRPSPVLLRPRRFSGLLDRKVETDTSTHAMGMFEPVEFYARPGFGKTSLLRHLAHRLPTTLCPDGVVYLSARRQNADDLLQFLFDAFYESNIPTKPANTQIQHALQGKQALILLDDVMLDRDDVETVMDIVPNSVFFLASHQRCLWGEGRAVALKGLPQTDALALLERELGQVSAEERPVAESLCGLLQGHPLHILQVAAVVREDGRSLAELVKQLPKDVSDAKLAAQLLAALPEPERRVMGLLAALNGVPLPTEHLVAITGLPNPEPVLESLMQRKLIQAHSPRYSLTGTLNQSLSQGWDLMGFTRSALGYFVNWTQTQQPSDDLLESADIILYLQEWATRTGRWQESVDLARAIEGVLSLNGRWGAWEQVLQTSLRSAEALNDYAGQAWCLHQLGTRSLCLEHSDLARTALKQALRLREMLGDQAGAAITRHNLDILPPLPPPADGQPPVDTPPPEPLPLAAAPPTLMELGVTALLYGAILSLVVLLAAIGGMWLFSQLSPAVSSPVPVSNLVFVTITPTPTPSAIRPQDTPTTSSGLSSPTPGTPSATVVSTAAISAPASTPLPQPDAVSTLTPTFTLPLLVNTPTFTPVPALTPSATSTVDPCLPPPDWVAYITEFGDTLDSLAARTYTTISELQRVNCLNSFIIQPGQIIYLPFFPATLTPSRTATRVSSATLTPTQTSTRVSSATPTPTQTSTRIPSVTPTPTQTSTRIPSVTPTNTKTATPTPTRSSPEISNVNPNFGDIGQEVVIFVQGRNFEAADGNFRVELVGFEARALLSVGPLRTSTDFEAIVPPSLPAGPYNLFVTNPDGQSAISLSAYEVIALPPTVEMEPEIFLDPDNLFFTDQPVKNRSQPQFVTLTNTGSANLAINDIILTGNNPGDFLVDHNCPANLAPNTACEIIVYFMPVTTGNRRADLTVLSNAPSSPDIVSMGGTGVRNFPDLVISSMATAGQPVINRQGQVEVPVFVVALNQGNYTAETFKVATEYTGGNISGNSVFVVPFSAEVTREVDPSGGYYPVTRNPLPAQGEVVFVGIITFSSAEQGATVSLWATADSCSGDEFMPPYCRVEEENENNNSAKPISVSLPKSSPSDYDQVN